MEHGFRPLLIAIKLTWMDSKALCSTGSVWIAARLALICGSKEGMEDDLVFLASVRCFVKEELIELGQLLKSKDPHSVQSDPLI